MSTVKGLHGAGEALRGTVNATIAKGMHDEKEWEQQRLIKEQGIREFRESGFREKAEQRGMRRRSGSRELRGSGLERVDERVANI